MRNKATYFSRFQLFSAVLMIIALLWLTVSTPFVFNSKQRIAAQKEQKAPVSDNSSEDDTATNPFGNTTEEKAPSGTNLSEEYLHHHDHSHYHFVAVISSLRYIHANASTYTAFHGELLVPPPNQA